jgi:pimeloyl-ACP methyl ester carboxylesterase
MKTELKSLKLISILFLLISFSVSNAQSLIDTTWNGSINITGVKIGIVVKFKTTSGVLSGTIDVPEQKAFGMELSDVSFNKSNVHFVLSGSSPAVFEGTYYTDSISGSFKQSGATGSFVLAKGESVTSTTTTSENPTDVPYNAEEINFSNDGNFFAGTLTYPKIQGKHPAVVMITGSGAQNRDEEIFGFKIFGIIADHLTRSGIAVLRYDDRGTGSSVGKSVDESTTEDFAGDVIAAVEFLKTKDYINPNQIGLFGHSEGGIVAPLAASNSNSIGFIILMAGTSVMGIDIVKEQSKLIMKANNSSDKEIEGYVTMLDSIYAAIKNKQPLDELKQRIKNDIIENFDQIPKEERKAIKNKEQYATDVAEMTIAEFNTNWMKYFLRYDPYDALTQIKCPVLALFGELDLQVPPNQNEPQMTKALKNGGNYDYKVITFPKANHLFQEAVTGSPGEYSSLKKEFVSGFLETISAWILERVAVVK